MKINTSNLDYESLFRTWRYSENKISLLEKFLINSKLIFKILFLKVKIINSDKFKNRPKVLYTHQRQDYTNLINKICNSASLNLSSIFYKVSLKHDLGNIRIVLKYFKSKELDFHECLLLYFLMKNNDIFFEFIETESIILLFAEMQLYENFVAQLAKQHDIYTIGFQHGFYVDDKAISTLNSINYKNIKVDELLVWGSYSKKLIDKQNPKVKSTIVGRPSTHFLSSLNFNYKATKPSCYVGVLDGYEFNETNQEIINVVSDLASKDGLAFFLKPHPNLSTNITNKYQLLSNITDLGSSPIFVGCRSSLLLELTLDKFLCIAIKESPFFDIKNINHYDHDKMYRKLSLEDVSLYISNSSPIAESLIANAINKYV